MSIKFKEIIQKIVNIEVKASLKSSIMIWDLDAYYFKGYCLFHNTFSKMQTQGSIIKKSKLEKS